MKAPTASGSDSSIALADAFSGPRRAYGLGTGKRDDRRLRRIASRSAGDSGT